MNKKILLKFMFFENEKRKWKPNEWKTLDFLSGWRPAFKRTYVKNFPLRIFYVKNFLQKCRPPKKNIKRNF